MVAAHRARTGIGFGSVIVCENVSNRCIIAFVSREYRRFGRIGACTRRAPSDAKLGVCHEFFSAQDPAGIDAVGATPIRCRCGCVERLGHHVRKVAGLLCMVTSTVNSDIPATFYSDDVQELVQIDVRYKYVSGDLSKISKRMASRGLHVEIIQTHISRTNRLAHEPMTRVLRVCIRKANEYDGRVSRRFVCRRDRHARYCH